ncbi:hypothetical protein JNK13_09200 [bacterium]|nr:hypothetical protein [bacterium]
MEKKKLNQAVGAAADMSFAEFSRSVIAAAKTDAERILDAAEAEGARLIEAGQVKVQADALHELGKLIANFKVLERNFLIEQIKRFSELSLEVAAEVIGEELVTNPASLKSRMERAYRMLPSGNVSIRIVVADEDRSYAEEFVTSLGGTKFLSVETSAAMPRGSAEFQIGGSSIILSIADHFSRIKAEILSL